MIKATETANQTLMDIAITIENTAKNLKEGKISLFVEEGKIIKIMPEDPQTSSLVYSDGGCI